MTSATPTSTVSPTPIPQGWYASDYTYSTDIPHAVTEVDRGSFSDSFTYDLNGNMTCRTESGVTYKQTYNAENRIASIQKLASGTCAAPTLAAKWDFTYDGDGVRTAQSYTPYTDGQPGTPVFTRYYFGGAYETTGTAWKKYYSFAGQTVAMRDASQPAQFKYFLSDHLGSVSVVFSDSNGDGVIEQTEQEQQRYLPFGQARVMPPYASVASTDFTYTGQRNLPDTGLMDYNARFYSPALGRFIQPDSIIPYPASPQSWNRFSYVTNNPLRYTDPTGHRCVEEGFEGSCHSVEDKMTKKWKADIDKKRSEVRESEGNRYCYTHRKECGIGGNSGDGITAADILLENSNFNPFASGFEYNPDDYRGSNAEAMDDKFLEWYKSQGIDIDFYASQGLPNPLNHNQVPNELVARLPLLANDTETRFFIMKMAEATGNDFSGNMLNYEANYVYSLMRSYPDVLAASVVDYNSEENMYRDILDQWIDKPAPAPAIPPPGASE